MQDVNRSDFRLPSLVLIVSAGGVLGFVTGVAVYVCAVENFSVTAAFFATAGFLVIGFCRAIFLPGPVVSEYWYSADEAIEHVVDALSSHETDGWGFSTGEMIPHWEPAQYWLRDSSAGITTLWWVGNSSCWKGCLRISVLVEQIGDEKVRVSWQYEVIPPSLMSFRIAAVVRETNRIIDECLRHPFSYAIRGSDGYESRKSHTLAGKDLAGQKRWLRRHLEQTVRKYWISGAPTVEKHAPKDKGNRCVVEIHLKVARAADLSCAEITSSSGLPALDQLALNSVKTALSSISFPTELPAMLEYTIKLANDVDIEPLSEKTPHSP